MRYESADVVIIGAGASGLAAAIEIGMTRPDLDVVVLEKNEEPGRKIRATGSGRCNISNTGAVGYPEIMEFFHRIGLVTREFDNGLVYPYSESAADVAELLEARALETGARIITGAECTAVRQSKANRRFAVNYRCGNYNAAGKSKDGYSSAGGDAVIYADYVILAVGGKAGPNYGTTGDGYRIARELGHSIVTPVPVLTGIECLEWGSGPATAADNRAGRNAGATGFRRDEGDDKTGINGDTNAIILAGTRTRGRVKLYKVTNHIIHKAKTPEVTAGGQMQMEQLCEESGEIQFTRYGLSGICVFNLTRHMRYNRTQGESIGDFIVSADLFPDGDIREFLANRREHAHPEELTGDVLRTVLKENIARYVLDKVDNIRLLCTEHQSKVTATATQVIKTHQIKMGRTQASHIPLQQIPVRDLTDADIDAIAAAVHDLTFHPSGIRGWKEAQATSGGVSTSEINADTCESMLVSGLYITGELADRDYPCGGYNLSNAWLTGLRAAHSIASFSSS